MANSVDLEQWPRFVTCDLGLYSLLRSVCPNIQCKYGMERCTAGRKCLLMRTPGFAFGY